MARFFGIEFPFKRGATSTPKDATDDELIRQSLIQIVNTPTAARIMRPDFGIDAWALLFENTGEAMVIQLENAIRVAIAQYEPRVIVVDIQIDQDDSEVKATITYVLVSSQETQQISLTLPTA